LVSGGVFSLRRKIVGRLDAVLYLQESMGTIVMEEADVTGKKTPVSALFYTKTDHFTTTGSGQTWEKLRKEWRFLTEMGPDAAWVLGRVHHTIAGVAQQTRFTLVLRRIGEREQWDGWRIVHDHSSTEDEGRPQPKL
jgi:ketosteroid isomerase-like protein